MLGRDELVEIPLPEDNAAALRIICAVLHHRSELLPSILAAGDVLEIAMKADKYECVASLSFAIRIWLQPRENEVGDLMCCNKELIEGGEVEDSGQQALSE